MKISVLSTFSNLIITKILPNYEEKLCLIIIKTRMDRSNLKCLKDKVEKEEAVGQNGKGNY